MEKCLEKMQKCCLQMEQEAELLSELFWKQNGECIVLNAELGNNAAELIHYPVIPAVDTFSVESALRNAADQPGECLQLYVNLCNSLLEVQIQLDEACRRQQVLKQELQRKVERKQQLDVHVLEDILIMPTGAMSFGESEQIHSSTGNDGNDIAETTPNGSVLEDILIMPTGAMSFGESEQIHSSTSNILSKILK